MLLKRLFHISFYIISINCYSAAVSNIVSIAGFGRTRENVGFTCVLCEEDLSYMPSENYESEYYDDLESDPLNYPEVAILQCGHSFHVRCFANTIPDEQCTDPPCVFCDSYLT